MTLLRCLLHVLLYGAIFMLGTKPSFALISGDFNVCSKSSCNSSLSNRPCAVENNVCKCTASNNHACDALDQQAFVNLTGALDEIASQWTCCFCSLQTSYCCNKCTDATAQPAVILPTRYYRVILVFVLECSQFSGNEQKLSISLGQGIARLTGIPLARVIIKDITCTTGQRPFCGVDVEDIRAHHRARRLVGGRSMKGKSNSKKQNGDSSYNSYRKPIDVTCHGLAANITVYGKNLTLLNTSLDLLGHLQSNNSLVIPLWDGRSIYSSFMLSAVDGTSYSLHEAPTTEPPPSPPTDSLPPLELDLTPLFYALGSILGLVSLCVLWKFFKHSWLLYKKKFTPINSDRVDHNKARQLQRITEAMEENNCTSHVNGRAFVTTSSSLFQGDNEAMTQQYNWSSPRSLAPAYKPTELHNQRTPPKLVVGDEGSDIDRHSLDSASVINMEDDEHLSDILNSDDERVLRASSRSSHFSRGLGNPGFLDDKEEAKKTVSTRHSSKMGTKPNSPRLVNGNARAKLLSNSSEERKGSLVSSDLSSNAEENTAFLPLKMDKKNKQDSEKQKKSKKLSPLSNNEKNVRRTSISPLDEDGKTRKQSAIATEIKTKKKTLTLQDVRSEGRRKSILTTDHEVKIVTPKDKYMKGGKNTRVFTFESETKSDIQDRENPNKNKTKIKERLVTPLGGRRKSMTSDGEDNKSSLTAPVSGRRKSMTSDREDIKNSLTAPVSGRRKSMSSVGEDNKSSDTNEKTMSDRLTAPVSGRKKSLFMDGEEATIFDGNKRKANERSTTPANKTTLAADEENAKASGKNRTKTNKNSASRESTDKENTKRKKKKLKTQKETRRKAEDSDDTSDLEEGISTAPRGLASLNVIPATPEMQRPVFVTSGVKETKKKKKKRKEKEATKRRSEDSEHSDEDVEDMIKQLTANFVSPETKRRRSLAPEETERKKKKQKNGTTAKRKSENAAAMHKETNGDFSQSAARNIKAESLTVKPQKRKKSLVLEDMESKSQTTDMETWKAG